MQAGNGAEGAAAGSGGVLLGEAAKQARIQVEMQASARCGGCKRRLTEDGTEFFAVVVQMHEGQGAVILQKTVACSRDDCDYFERCKPGSHGMRPVPGWTFLKDEDGNPLGGGGTESR